MDPRFLPCQIDAASSLGDLKNDVEALIVITDDLEKLRAHDQSVYEQIQNYAKLDHSVASGGVSVVIGGPTKVIILGHTGDVSGDYADIRSYSDVAESAMQKALSMKFRRVALLSTNGGNQFPTAELVSTLGALRAAYVPLEIRESRPERASKLDSLVVVTQTPNLVHQAKGIESGRWCARDVSSGNPERMAPPKVAEYIQDAFQPERGIKIRVVEDQNQITKDYPCMAAVNRADLFVPRHHARLIYLEYVGEGEIEETLMFVGKGVTLDTGGLDVKTNGNMFGMSLDKSGSGAVGGIFKTLESLKPRGIKVMGYMAMVRNSVGAEAFSCDEKLVSRSGKRILIGNTDAEGRLTMMDPLTEMVEWAPKEKNPHLFTIATLTGHAVLTFGEGYSIAVDNAPAKADNSASKLLAASRTVGDMVESTNLRREDFEFHRGKSEYEDLVQANTKPSSQTPRGHITPAALLIMASRLDQHGSNSACPLRYTHIDMAGNEGPFPGVPFGSPVSAIAARYFLPRL